jgi:phosphatidylserine/phosphatidylglycerophosphate/cardiolipin synthase-like enzyme
MVIDRQLVIGGSFNYTGPANRLNDENILILGDLDTSDPATKQRQQQLADYALAEIDRIITNFGSPLARGRVLQR